MDLVNTVISFLSGAFVTYSIIQNIHTNKKFQLFEKFIEEFPTPEEMAKQVLNVKLPINELPQDLKEQLDEIAKKYSSTKSPTPMEIKDMGYVG